MGADAPLQREFGFNQRVLCHNIIQEGTSGDASGCLPRIRSSQSMAWGWSLNSWHNTIEEDMRTSYPQAGTLLLWQAHRLGGAQSKLQDGWVGVASCAPCSSFCNTASGPAMPSIAVSLLDGVLSDRKPQGIVPTVASTEKGGHNRYRDPLFKPGVTQLEVVAWVMTSPTHLADAVTEYVREGYNQAIERNETTSGFSHFMQRQRLSTRAIRLTLERRLAAPKLQRLSHRLSDLTPEGIGHSLTEEQLEVSSRPLQASRMSE